MNKKRNIIITAFVIVLIFVGILVYLGINYTADENALTVIEKKWITNNLNNVVDVNVYNDIPVYGYNGDGIIFGFLDYVTKETNINFNKISYYTDSDNLGDVNLSFQVVDSNSKLLSNDILLYQDNYVILDNDSTSLVNLNDNFKLGVINADFDICSNYFDNNIELVKYDNVEALISGLKALEVDYILLNNLGNMDDILVNDLRIVYHVLDLKKNFIIRTNDKVVKSVFSKLYNEYKLENYDSDYTKNYLNIYYKSTDTSDLLQKNYNAKTYKYGYVINMPYENYVNNQFVGTILNYLELLEENTGAEIESVIYANIDNLKSALISGEVDFALANFSYDNINFEHVLTGSFRDLEYVVISKNNYSINSLKGLLNEKVSVVSSSLLYQELVNNGIETVKYSNTDELLRNVDDYSIVILDKETYMYYKASKLVDYNVILESSIKDGYKFILNSSNEPFNSLFSYFISTISYQNIKSDYNTDVTLDKDYTSLKIFSFIIILVLILLISILFMNKKSVTNPVITKDDKLKYIDPMTSLKNRNYLNLNIYKWDDNVIFPQSVVILDIYRLRDINDTYGREAGDEVIKRVASILINNQLENTDIIRSGGDEFLIYMIGYEEKKVSEYTKKLVRDMKDIPNSLGIEVGYSMILDEVKTVDDAINEAVSMMTKNKEKKRSKEQEGK